MTRVIRAVGTGLLAAAAAACGTANAPAAGGQASPSAPAGGTHSPGSPGGCATHVVARDGASGSAVCVGKGGDLIVMLRNPHGTQWSSPHLTGRALGPALPIPTPSGTVGWEFRAVAAGPAMISLTRPACRAAQQGTAACAAILFYRLRVTVR